MKRLPAHPVLLLALALCALVQAVGSQTGLALCIGCTDSPAWARIGSLCAETGQQDDCCGSEPAPQMPVHMHDQHCGCFDIPLAGMGDSGSRLGQWGGCELPNLGAMPAAVPPGLCLPTPARAPIAPRALGPPGQLVLSTRSTILIV